MSFQLARKTSLEIKVKPMPLTKGERLSVVIDVRELGETAVYWVQQRSANLCVPAAAPGPRVHGCEGSSRLGAFALV